MDELRLRDLPLVVWCNVKEFGWSVRHDPHVLHGAMYTVAAIIIFAAGMAVGVYSQDATEAQVVEIDYGAPGH